MFDKQLSTVLVVDDNHANRYAVSRILRSAGFETTEASNGRQAMESARLQPDLIVLDVNLPDMSGFDVVRSLRADPATAPIPVLHLSASYMREEDRVYGLENGANAYLTHPLEPPVFIATVRSLIRLRHLEEQRESAAAEWIATFDAISDLVCVVDATGTITRANRAAAAVLDRTGRPVVDRGFVALITGAYPGLDPASLTQALAGRQATVGEHQTRDRWLRIAFDPLPTTSTYAGATVCVTTDITQRKQADAERAALLDVTQRARADAEEANRAKSEFLATMSHEVRTPINAILGYAQILDMGISGAVSPEQRAQLDRLRRSAAHLLTLVNELLDLGKLESGRLRMAIEDASVDEVLEDALAIARPQALARAITIDRDLSTARGLRFVGDTGRVRQILVNLLSNAIKFSAPGSPIEIWCESSRASAGPALHADQQYITFNIRDTGVGVSQSQIASIFEPFVQGETGTTRTWGGSGLGLAISRRLARLMDGEITVASAERQGSRFTLWVPAAQDQSLIVTTEQPAVRAEPTTPFDPASLAQLGRVVVMESLAVAQAVAAAIRSDDTFPPMGNLSDAQLVDHIPAYLADLGLALSIVSELGVEASTLLQDGSAIRAEIAERHGAQRRRLGWTPAHIVREYDVIVEEVERTLHTRAEAIDQQFTGAMALIGRLVEQSKAASIRSHREAGGTED